MIKLAFIARYSVYRKITRREKKSYAGLAIELERNPDSPQETCEELFEKYNNDNGKQLILDIAFLGEKYTVEDVTIITKEEYYRDFSDEEDEEVTDV